MRLKTCAALAAAITLPFISACGNDAANDGFVRNINATSEYASLDLYTRDSNGNDVALVSGTAAGTASAYAGLKKGGYTFDVKSSSSTGSPTPATGTVSKDDHFAVITYLTGTTTKTQFVSEDETPPSSGNAKLRVFNAAAGEAASVDVYVTKAACSALGVTDSPFAAAVTGLQASYVQVTASTSSSPWNVCVVNAGDTSTLLLDIEGLVLKDQEVATLVLTRTTGGVLLNGALLDQQGAYTAYSSAIARLRVVADAAGRTPISLSIGGTEIASQQPSPSIATYLTVPAGTLSPTILYGSTSTSGYTLPTLTAGNDYTLLVAGDAGAPAVSLITDSNMPSTSTTNTVKVRVINGLNGVSGSVSATVDGKPVGTAAFGAASPAYTNIAATSGTSSVHAIINGVTVPDLLDKSFLAGNVETIFVYGDTTFPVLNQSIDR